jgi:hypothetical protein
MSDHSARVGELHLRLNASKRIAVGQGLPPFGLTAKDSDCRSKADFSGLVTRLYTWYWEEIAEDRSFLMSIGQEMGSVKAFNDVLTSCRTSFQHRTDEKNVRAKRADRWLAGVAGVEPSEPADWAACGDQLLEELCTALAALATVARAVDADEAAHWSEVLSQTPEQQIALACEELGLNLRQVTLDYVIRQFAQSYERKNSTNTARRQQLAANMCVGTDLRILPIPYQKLLDELGVLGTPNGRAALLVAHAVAETRVIGADGFVEAVAAVWRVVLDAEQIGG